MALEDLTGADKHIDDLVKTNPVGGTDYGSSLDDHARGIKNVLKNTFPNVDGPVTGTPAELNSLTGRIAFIDTFLQAADEAAALAALAIETTIKATARLFTSVQTPSFLTHTVSVNTAAVAWDCAITQTLFLIIDAAGQVTITLSNVTKGATYTLHVTNTTTGQTVVWAGATVVDGINIIGLDNTVSKNFISMFADATGNLIKLGQENYT